MKLSITRGVLSHRGCLTRRDRTRLGLRDQKRRLRVAGEHVERAITTACAGRTGERSGLEKLSIEIDARREIKFVYGRTQLTATTTDDQRKGDGTRAPVVPSRAFACLRTHRSVPGLRAPLRGGAVPQRELGSRYHAHSQARGRIDMNHIKRAVGTEAPSQLQRGSPVTAFASSRTYRHVPDQSISVTRGDGSAARAPLSPYPHWQAAEHFKISFRNESWGDAVSCIDHRQHARPDVGTRSLGRRRSPAREAPCQAGRAMRAARSRTD